MCARNLQSYLQKTYKPTKPNLPNKPTIYNIQYTIYNNRNLQNLQTYKLQTTKFYEKGHWQGNGSRRFTLLIDTSSPSVQPTTHTAHLFSMYQPPEVGGRERPVGGAVQLESTVRHPGSFPQAGDYRVSLRLRYRASHRVNLKHWLNAVS